MKEKIDKIVGHTWTLRAAKFGFLIRGIIYLFAGFLGLELAVGIRRSGGSLTEVLTFISSQTFGQFFLSVLFVGLIGYALWGILRGVFNVLGEDSDLFGWITRLGYLISAVSYAILAYAAWSIINGVRHIHESGDPTQLSRKVLQFPFGKEILIIVGFCWIIGAVIQIVSALRAEFKDNLKMKEINKKERHWPIIVGKIGIISRSIIFLFIGMFIVKAAWNFNPSEAYSVGEVLNFLMRLPFGAVIVGVLSFGLMCFGIFSSLQTWYVKLPSK